MVPVVVSSAVATSAVLALVAALILAFGQPAQPAGAYADAREAAADPGLEAVSGPPPGSPAASSTRPAPSLSVAPAVTPAVPRVAVLVLNQTSRSGLAAEFRDVLDDAGWTVGGVDTFRGTVPATTVYYPPGLRSAAQALNAAFAQVHRVRPAFPGIPADKLTVILCKDYPSG